MLLFFSFVILTIIFILLIVLSEIKIIIDNLEISMTNENIESVYEIRIEVFILKKIKLLKLIINNNDCSQLFKKDTFKKKIEKIKRENLSNRKIDIDTIKKVKKIIEYFNVNLFNLKLYIDTEDIIFTSYLVGIISAILPNLLRNLSIDFKGYNCKYSIVPIYNNKNYIFLKFDSIISIKIVHIINMLKTIRGRQNERASNRRFNVNCYGKY